MAEKSTEATEMKLADLDCCPKLIQHPICDTLNFRYRLPFRPQVEANGQRVPVEVVLHFRLERCSGPLVQGDPIYSTTLLPGEEVRLFTSNRHARWSYDSETNLAYRHETTSEESFYTAGMAHAMSDLTINEKGSAQSSYGESWAEGGGGASVSLFGIIDIGGGGGGGSYDSHSASAFAHSLSRHAESASRYVAVGVRAKSSTSVGEVDQRTHAQGQSAEQYESASRMFRNENKCHAVTYLFYRINKLQRVRFKLVAIERRIDDPKTPTGAYQRIPLDTKGGVTVLPQSIPATSKNRLAVEQMARTSIVEQHQAATLLTGAARPQFLASAFAAAPMTFERTEATFDLDLRRKALEKVDEDLVRGGLLDARTKAPTEKIITELSWEREDLLPTPGIIVKGCLDKCDTCETARQKGIELDLERKRLENEMLKKQIELLAQSQEYRCCPGGSEVPEESPDE